MKRPHRLVRWGRFCASALLVAFALLTLVRAFVADVYSVPSESMEPALRPGDRIAVLKWPWQREARTDDVVVFDGRGSLAPESPDGVRRTAAWLVGRNEGDQFVKRVAAVGPARVTCTGDDGALLLNGHPAGAAEAPLTGAERCGKKRFDSLVPEGRLWLLGDNRARSTDSRDLLGAPGGGAVPEGRVVGRVIAVWHTGGGR